MSDEKFEDFLRSAAKGYNTPPARAPRDEMWNAIQAKRSAGPRVVYGGATGIRTEDKRFGSKVWWAAAAGLVLVASGIGIGRWTANVTAPSQIAVAPAPTQATPQSSNPSVDSLPSGANEPASSETRSTQQIPFSGSEPRVAVAQGSRGVEPRATAVASNAPSVTRATPDRSGTTPGSGARGNATSAYELAEVNHLTAAEALLTSFRTRSPADQQQDARLAAWARELLSNTRLLLDSPVAADPQRRPLLQDLELLLVQIVQLAPGGAPQDREIMERTLQQDQFMTKLRTAIPAGQHGS
jgi:hypothetical protein